MSKDTDIRTNPVQPDEASELGAALSSVSGDPKADIHNPTQDSPQEISRRKFLNKISLALSGVGGVVIAVPVVGFIIGPLINTKSKKDIWRSVGPLNSFKVGETVEVKFADASPLPWAGVVAQTAAWLRRDSQDHVTAFAVNCTHLGCPVSWLPEAGLFMCPCHGGVYYNTGEVAAGPPPAALPKYEVRIREEQVEIKAAGIPLSHP